MKILIVVDMQNDFIDGPLGSDAAKKIVKNVSEKVDSFRRSGEPVIFTRDTHTDTYLETLEGKNLPVKHCIKGTDGWQITNKITTTGSTIVDKVTFGSKDLPQAVKNAAQRYSDSHKGAKATGSSGVISEIILTGLCTDMCVISNAMVLKTFFPETQISVLAGCCAGVTLERHLTALNAMKSCQITVK
ncbi:MAG: cysteine hydrolase [Treponema sp.]|jgi:nicotinamidase-related amidase|nr:cysteine hydrolase [Treponema sp.]